MVKNSENLLEKLSESLESKALKLGNFGIEKEGLRVLNSQIARSSHKDLLGPALCNEFITTDFSDALLELITPPLCKKSDGFQFLDDIHHFVSKNIGNETIWPFSMPPFVESEKDIEIAKYGKSNQGLFKVLYRNGLSNRYGRLMQSIAGLHFNYSFNASFWDLPIFSQHKTHDEIKKLIYFRAIRNIQRMNWVILYFFGASPVVSKNFLNRGIKGFKKIKDAYYLEHSTSLRMSELGYQPISQDHLKISVDSMEDYVRDLLNATQTHSETFQKLFADNKDDNSQINSNVLQIEDEYYSVARPKSSSPTNKRLTSKLMNYGVDYIELRSLDLDPFSRTGIKKETIDFLEIFIVFCALTPSLKMSENEIAEIRLNDRLVSTMGRKEDLTLKKGGQDILLKDWAHQILDNMEKTASLFYKDKNIFSDYRNKINEPDETLSGKILSTMRKQNIGFHDFGKFYAKKYKKEYLAISHSENKNWEQLEHHRLDSIKKQNDLESVDNRSLEEYIEEYFAG